MGLNQIVNIVVTTANPGVTAQGFGIPLILAPVNWVERTRTFNTAAQVLADTGLVGAVDPAYMAAAAMFGQSPAPPTIMIGRQALPPTQRFAVGVKTALVGAQYDLRLAGPNAGAWASQVASYIALGAVAWAINTVYAKGAIVVNGGNIYVCITAGTSAGATGPTTTSLDITDNTVHWRYTAAGVAGGTNADAILGAIKALVDALAAPVLAVTTSLQGAAGSTSLRILANAAGAFFGAEVLDRSKLTLAMDHVDPGVATDLAAVLNESGQWYGLITVFNSALLAAAAGAWVETSNRLYAVDCLDTEIPQHALAAGVDAFCVLKSMSLARTHGFYHPANDEFAAAAEMGRFFPINPGGENWRLKTLAIVKVKTYSPTEEVNLLAKYANYYMALGSSAANSTNVIQGDGKVFANQYVDNIRFVDWYKANLQADLVNLLIQNNKISYTDLGVSTLENALRKRNELGIAAGGIAASPKPVITVVPVSLVATADKVARQYNGLGTSWTSAGAINGMTINVAIAP